MKLKIVLCVLAALVICSSSEKSKGRRSNIKIEQLLRNEKDNPSRGRFFHKKGNQASAPATFVIIEQAAKPPPPQPPSYYDYDYEPSYSYDVSVDGNFTVETLRGHMADDDDFPDSEDEVVNEQTQTPRRNERRNSNFKLKKINGKKRAYRLEKNAPATSSKNVKKLQMFRLNGDSNINKNPDNIAVRRLVIPQ